MVTIKSQTPCHFSDKLDELFSARITVVSTSSRPKYKNCVIYNHFKSPAHGLSGRSQPRNGYVSHKATFRMIAGFPIAQVWDRSAHNSRAIRDGLCQGRHALAFFLFR